MSSPDQKPQQRQLPEWLAARLREQQPEPDLATEVRALRQEIAALRAELKPVPSLILTGQQVAAEFKRLSEVRA